MPRKPSSPNRKRRAKVVKKKGGGPNGGYSIKFDRETYARVDAIAKKHHVPKTRIVSAVFRHLATLSDDELARVMRGD